MIEYRINQFKETEKNLPKKDFHSPEEKMLEIMKSYYEGDMTLSKFTGTFEDLFENKYFYGKNRTFEIPTEDKFESYEKVYQAIEGFLTESPYELKNEYGLDKIIREEADKLNVKKRNKILIDY